MTAAAPAVPRPDAATNRRSRSIVRTAALLAPLPLLFLLGTGMVRDATGPLHVGLNPDPSYVYLVNGLALAEGVAPRHVDHPGTPLQAVTALYLRLQGCGPGASCIAAVARDAESHLARLVGAVQAALAGALWVGGVLIALWTRDLASGWLFQAGPLLATVGWTEVAFLKPEPVLLLLGVVLAAIVLRERLAGAAPSRLGSAAVGVLGALLCATKITALPLALFGALSRSTRASRIAWAGGFAATLALALWPMLGDRGRMLEFFAAFVRFRGSYGTEESARPSLAEHLGGVGDLLAAEPALAVVLALSILVAGLAWRSRREVARPELALLAFALAAELLQLLLSGRQPRARYLLPAIALLGLNLVLVRRLLPESAWRRGRVALAVALPALALFQGARLAGSFRELEFQQTAARRAEAALAGAHPEAIVETYGSSSPAYAIWLGANYFDGRWGRELAALYPGFLALDPWKRRLVGFDVADRAPVESAASTRTRLRSRAPVRPATGEELEADLGAVGLALARPEELLPANRPCRVECVFELAPAAPAAEAGR